MPPGKPTHSVSFRLTSEAFLALARLKRIHGSYNAAINAVIVAAAKEVK